MTTKTEAQQDPRVKAIRDDKAVGRGTCSTMDECYSDVELFDAIVAAKCLTAADAVRWAREANGAYWESGLDQLSGESETDDPIRGMAETARLAKDLPIDC